MILQLLTCERLFYFGKFTLKDYFFIIMSYICVYKPSNNKIWQVKEDLRKQSNLLLLN